MANIDDDLGGEFKELSEEIIPEEMPDFKSELDPYIASAIKDDSDRLLAMSMAKLHQEIHHTYKVAVAAHRIAVLSYNRSMRQGRTIERTKLSFLGIPLRALKWIVALGGTAVVTKLIDSWFKSKGP